LARLALRIDKGRGAQVVAVHREDVEGVKLDLMIEFTGMLKSEMPSTPRMTASPEKPRAILCEGANLLISKDTFDVPNRADPPQTGI
jgi:hypothetical protein